MRDLDGVVAERDEACFGEVDFFVPNQVEAALFGGVEPETVTDWGTLGRQLRNVGPRTVIITLAGEGCVVVGADGPIHAPSVSVPVVDTTAAGDAFVGGLASALLRDMPLIEAVRFANACGAVAVSRTGAQPSLPTRTEVERLMVEGR